MSPVEPRPVVIGTRGLPSSDAVEDLRFLPNAPAAFTSAGATRLPQAAPTAARNDRRLQPSFRFMRSTLSASFANYRSPVGVGGLTTIALPTISMRESPGIHS